MNNSKLIVSVLLLLAVSLSCKLLNRTKPGGLSDADVSRIASALPAYDPTAPPPSPGAVALRSLAELEPSAGTLSREVELVERAALKKLLGELQVQLNAGAGPEQASSPARFETSRTVPVVAMSSASHSSMSSPALLFLQGRAGS